MGIQEIAALAGVSQATVSNALNGKTNVSEATRQHILQLCAQQGYAHTVKQSKETKTRSVLFVFSDFDRSFYLNIIKGIHDCLTQNGYDLIICTPESSARFMQKSMSVGAIGLDVSMQNAQLLAAAGEQYPIVVLDRIVPHPNIASVLVNNAEAMTGLVQALLDKGYKRFGYLSGQESLDNTERFTAFCATLQHSGIAFNPRLHFHGDYRDKSGYQAAKLMMLSKNLPQVLVSANDNMAIGALRAFREAGLSVPSDIAVTGFDGTGTADAVALTTVSIPRYETGFLAASKLLAMLDGDSAGEPTYLTAKPVFRASTL